MSNLAVYELTEEQESKTKMIYSFVKPFVPTTKKEAALAVAGIATGLASVKFGLSAVGAYCVYKDQQEKAKKINLETIERDFKNANENNWVESQYYIQHPKRKRKNVLIEANTFIRYIEDERLGEILDYLVREGRFNYIKLTSDNVNGFKGKVGASGFSIPSTNKDGEDKEDVQVNAKAEASGKTTAKHTIEFSNKNLPQIKSNEKPDYIWISSFKKLKSAVEGSKGTGECEINIEEEFVNDFTVDASLAAAINIDFNVETDKCYTITIEAKRTKCSDSFCQRRRTRKRNG